MLRKIVANGMLVATALAAAVALIELAVFPRLLRSMPTNQMSFNERFGQQLAQSSKADIVPRDYILITGDSYAVGLGDARDRAPPGTRLPYASAHVIRQRLGRDVLSVGNGGWSTPFAAAAPALFADQARGAVRYRIAPPAAIVFYFYEGNDLLDNLTWLRSRTAIDVAATALDEATADALVAAQIARDGTTVRRLARWTRANFPAVHFMAGATAALWRGRPGEGGGRPSRAAGNTTRALIDGMETALPDRLQAPPLTLTENQWTSALRVAKSALHAMARHNDGVPVTLVYVPSPLSSYRIVSPEVSVQGMTAAAPSGLVPLHHARLRRDICGLAADLGFGFIDASPALRAAASRGLVHGPFDWAHFNLEGYSVLGAAVAEGLADRLHLDPPRDCTPGSAAGH